MRILVIEDDTLLRQTLRKMLESGGHDVLEATNGRTGLEVFRKHPFDVVVTDIVMPDQEGIETIRSIRDTDPSIRIVAISGGGRTRNMDFLKVARKFGADATLPKPFGKEAFLACVEGREATAADLES